MDTADWLEQLVADAFDPTREGERDIDSTSRRVLAQKILTQLGFAYDNRAKKPLAVLAAALRALEAEPCRGVFDSDPMRQVACAPLLQCGRCAVIALAEELRAAHDLSSHCEECKPGGPLQLRTCTGIGTGTQPCPCHNPQDGAAGSAREEPGS
jgi:hypothetical protein